MCNDTTNIFISGEFIISTNPTATNSVHEIFYSCVFLFMHECVKRPYVNLLVKFSKENNNKRKKKKETSNDIQHYLYLHYVT